MSDSVLCGAGLEFIHGGKSTAHSWRCVLPAGHPGMHCTPNDSEWQTTPPRASADARPTLRAPRHARRASESTVALEDEAGPTSASGSDGTPQAAPDA